MHCPAAKTKKTAPERGSSLFFAGWAATKGSEWFRAAAVAFAADAHQLDA
jgi:hypothetical protein